MKIMDIIDDKYSKNGTWIKDGVLMCNKECCGAPVSECSCDSSCKKCNCYNLKEEGVVERYGMRYNMPAQNRKATNTVVNATKRANNKARRQNNNVNIKNDRINRKNTNMQKRVATGIPSQALASMGGAPEGQA